MIHFGWAIAALFFGGFIGFFTAGLCCAAGREDERRLRDSVERLWEDSQRERFDS